MEALRCRSAGDHHGTTLTEILVGLAILSVLGLAVIGLLRGSARGTARVGENQLATNLAARVMDQFLFCGYRMLSQEAGKTAEIDFVKLGVTSEATSPSPREVLIDGFTIAGHYSVDLPDRGLARVLVTVTWRRAGQTAATRSGTFSLVRYVADPTVCMSVRGAFGGAEA